MEIPWVINHHHHDGHNVNKIELFSNLEKKIVSHKKSIFEFGGKKKNASQAFFKYII